MKIIESVLEYDDNRDFIFEAYKRYAEVQLYWGNWNALIGEEILGYIATGNDPFDSYEAFLNDVNDEREDWLCDNDLDWYETFDGFVEVMFECDLDDYIYNDDVEGFKERIDEIFKVGKTDCTWDILFDNFRGNLYQQLNKNVKKVFGLDYRNVKNKLASYMFCGMLSGYFDEDEFGEFIYDNYDYEFNTANFKWQDDLDLTCKFIDNTLSIADKAEAGIIFDDIKERLIAA